MDVNLFVHGIQAPDRMYNIIRDGPNPYTTQIRSFMENLWRKYRPYADKHFMQQMQVDLDSRFWEMYLACTLLENSIPPSSSPAGPDILIEHESGRIWIEAIAPTGGADNNPDRVPDMKPGVVTEVPGDEIVLRYRAAISEKYDRKYHSYVESGLIMPTDSYIIAINGCKIDAAIMETEHPRILKAVFPIGDLQVTIDTKTGIVIDTKYQLRFKIRRASGADVRTDLFLNPEYASLSGVLYSYASVRKVPNKMGEDFVLIHNPLATNRLPYGFLKVGREYIPTEDNGEYTINVTNWN
jgi:type I restriction enzyme S subunit